jgi:hypothetical protein
MAGAWNEGDWGLGNFGQQNNVTVPVTSVVDTPIAWNAGNFDAIGYAGLWRKLAAANVGENCQIMRLFLPAITNLHLCFNDVHGRPSRSDKFSLSRCCLR